jgi:hypothetical protein
MSGKRQVGKKWWMKKPFRNLPGVVPKPILGSPRANPTELVSRVQQLVAGGAIAKPVWLDAVLAHPPPIEHRFNGPRPVRLEWREEDRLRRVWQRRNPEASMHPKVLFVDESQLPASVIEHPADTFVKRQQALMRKGLSEEEAYRRVLKEQQEERRASDGEAAAARKDARALGATPVGDRREHEGFAERLLRRFAEEARDGGHSYPRHWFDDEGKWSGIGKTPLSTQLDSRTMRGLQRAKATSPDALARQYLDDIHLEDRDESDETDETERDSAANASGDADGVMSKTPDDAEPR